MTTWLPSSIIWYDYMQDDFSPGYFKFPVPISDIGNATFNREEKALLMMRYIRKHIETIEKREN